MKKKGDLATPIIMWLAVLVVVIIIVSWYVKSIRPLNAESSVIEYDLRQLFLYVDNACTSKYYYVKYNPRMNYGEINFNESKACIKTEDLHSCVDLTCNISNYLNVKLAEIINVVITKSGEHLNVTVEEYVI